MTDLILKYIPLPYTDSGYVYDVIAEQISRDLVTMAHIPTSLVALALAIYLYVNTKKLSSFYLMLLTITFFAYAYTDLMAWTSNTHTMYFGWSLAPVLAGTVVFLAYWFLYAFVKGKDLPLWQKVASLLTLTPFYYAALTNSYLSDYYNHSITPIESDWVMNYNDAVNIGFLLIVVVFTMVEYQRAQGQAAKVQTLYAGLGVFAMLAIFTSSYFMANMLHDLGFLVGTADNASVYAFFGMPIMVALLGYLVAKHGAFGMRMLQSVGYAILLMVVMFLIAFI
jgi:hypothetical protein